MDATAIQEIQAGQTTEVINAAVKQVDENLVAMPNDYKLHDLTAYLPYKRSFSAQFATKSVDDFVAYSTEYDNAGAKCFINGDQMKAIIVFDIGETTAALRKENTASLTMEKVALFQTLLTMGAQTKISQKIAAEFLEDWRDAVVRVNTMDGETMTAQQAITAIRDITIEAAREVNSKVSDFGQSMSAQERIEARNANKIPSLITFKTVTYNGLIEREIALKLSILTGDEKPSISFRIPQQEALIESIVEEFKNLIIDDTASFEMKTFIGSYN